MYRDVHIYHILHPRRDQAHPLGLIVFRLSGEHHPEQRPIQLARGAAVSLEIRLEKCLEFGLQTANQVWFQACS